MTSVWGDRVAEVNLELYQGEDFRYSVEFKQPDGQPLDLTGCSAIAKVRRHFIQEVAAFGVEIPSPATGQIVLTLSQIQLPPASYSWDLFLVNSAGKHEPKIAGSVIVYG